MIYQAIPLIPTAVVANNMAATTSKVTAAASGASALLLQQREPPLEQLLNGLALLLILVITTLCLVGFMVVLVALLPRVSERSQAALHRSPWQAFFIGLANYLFLGGIGLLLLSTQIPPLAVVGLLIIACLTIVTVIGLTGIVTLIGERMAHLRSQETSALKQLVWGTIALEFALLLPFAGWFLLTPILLMISFGAAVLAWRNRKQKESGELEDDENSIEAPEMLENS